MHLLFCQITFAHTHIYTHTHTFCCIPPHRIAVIICIFWLPWVQDREDPFYLVDLGRLLDLCDLWRERLPGVHPFYAVKCNSGPALLHMLAALGCGVEDFLKAVINA